MISELKKSPGQIEKHPFSSGGRKVDVFVLLYGGSDENLYLEFIFFPLAVNIPIRGTN